MGVHLPEKNKTLAAVVDRTLRACYALCFGADPLDPNGLSESQEDRAFVRDRFALPVRLGGGGFRPTVERALFLNTPNNVAPQFLATEQTRGDGVCNKLVRTLSPLARDFPRPLEVETMPENARNNVACRGRVRLDFVVSKVPCLFVQLLCAHVRMSVCICVHACVRTLELTWISDLHRFVLLLFWSLTPM